MRHLRAGGRWNSDEHLVDPVTGRDTGQVGTSPKHRHQVKGHALLERIVVNETSHVIAEMRSGANLAKQRHSRSPCAIDQYSFAAPGRVKADRRITDHTRQ